MRRVAFAVAAALMLTVLAAAALVALRDEPAVFTDADAEEAVKSAIKRCRRWAPASDPPAGR
ncbi:MAG TPA: hypothetical protein VGR10_00750, partial [Thermoleophilaceae bacterium]|nr:hypothetical protein [Thermoleophilaceae bacterium]